MGPLTLFALRPLRTDIHKRFRCTGSRAHGSQGPAAPRRLPRAPAQCPMILTFSRVRLRGSRYWIITPEPLGAFGDGLHNRSTTGEQPEKSC
jgi:hypothetical protein